MSDDNSAVIKSEAVDVELHSPRLSFTCSDETPIKGEATETDLNSPTKENQIDIQVEPIVSEEETSVAVADHADQTPTRDEPSDIKEIEWQKEKVTLSDEIRFKDIIEKTKCRYFVIKSANLENVSLAKAKNVWATSVFNERRLNSAFKSCHNVFLIFSVVESGRFCGFARLLNQSDDCLPRMNWVLPPFKKPTDLSSSFSLQWITRGFLDFTRCSHLQNTLNDKKPVKIARDGQEVNEESGRNLCLLFPYDNLSIDYDDLLTNLAVDNKNKILEREEKFVDEWSSGGRGGRRRDHSDRQSNRRPPRSTDRSERGHYRPNDHRTRRERHRRNRSRDHRRRSRSRSHHRRSHYSRSRSRSFSSGSYSSSASRSPSPPRRSRAVKQEKFQLDAFNGSYTQYLESVVSRETPVFGGLPGMIQPMPVIFDYAHGHGLPPANGLPPLPAAYTTDAVHFPSYAMTAQLMPNDASMGAASSTPSRSPTPPPVRRDRSYHFS